METLYDLLGALPRDDADGLRTAFRRAAKGAHPDLNPGDPDAGLKFRQIARANEILADVEQRAAYDHLLDLARFEQEQSAKYALAGAIHKIASGVMALTAVSAAAAGGYLVLIHLSTSAGAPANIGDLATREPAVIVAAAPAEPAPPESRADAAAEATEPVRETVLTEMTDAPPAAVGPPLDLVPNDARLYRSLGIAAYKSGDLNGALADFDQAIQFDPKFAPSYIDRGIVLYRMGRFDRAFADIARAKRLEKTALEKAGRPAPAATAATTKKPRPPQIGFDSAARAASPRRTAEIDPSRLAYIPSTRR